MPRQPATPSYPLRARLGVTLLILFGLLVVGSFVALLFGSVDAEYGANVAIIPVKGVLTTAQGDGLFSDPVASSTDIVEDIARARDAGMRAIILEIDSPGGSAVASDEVAQAVKTARDDGVIVVAWVRELGASGAYWIASSSDHVVAHRMSVTGSIGVIGSYLEFDEFLDDWNVTYQRLVAGERKDVGDPFTQLSPAKRAFLQGKLDTIHRFFIQEVADNRNMTFDEVAPLADGRFFLGVEAYEVGLVDELGGKQEAIAYLEAALNATVITTEYEDEDSLLELLAGVLGPRAPSVQDLAQERLLAQDASGFVSQLR